MKPYSDCIGIVRSWFYCLRLFHFFSIHDWKTEKALLLLLFLGALVSGIDAGLSYSDWPLMNGRVIPEDLFYLNPWHLNFLENPALVQFNHRLMGYCILIFGFVLWVRGITAGSSNKAQIMKYHRLFFVLALQVILGILAVLMSVPLILGLAHQLVAMLLLLCILNLRFSLSAERKIKALNSWYKFNLSIRGLFCR